MKSLLIGLFILGNLSAYASDVRDGLYSKISGSDSCASQIAIEVNDEYALIEMHYGEVVNQKRYTIGFSKLGRFETKTEITDSEIKQFVSQNRLLYGKKSVSAEIYSYYGNNPLVDFDLLYTFNDLANSKGFECRYKI